MLSSKTLVVGFVALFVTYSNSAPPTSKALGKTLIKHYDFPNQNVSFNHLSYNETHVAYGVYSPSDSEKNFKITLDHLDGSGKSLSCDLTIKVSDKAKNDGLVSVALLLNGGVLVLSKVGQKIKLTNVNFHGCSTNEAELAVDEDQHIFAVNVVAYEDSYDVFFANSKLCQKRSCRITFDNEGKVVKDTVSWGSDFVDEEEKFLGLISTVARHSPAKGFIIVQNAVNFPEAYVTNNEGKTLLTVKSVKDESDITVSTVGNYIGTCLSTWVEAPAPIRVLYTLECKQFDFDGKLLKTELQVNSSSLVGEDKKIHSFARLNLPEGFVLFTVLCPENYYGGCTNAESYVAYRLDGNGKTLKTVEINDFKCDKGTDLNLPRAFVSDAGQRCVSLGCNDWPTHTFSTGVRCFTDEEL